MPNFNHCHLQETYSANGYDRNINLAFLKGIVEAHERFSLGYLDTKKLRRIDTKNILNQERIYQYLGISRKKFLNKKYICKPPTIKKYQALRGKVLNHTKETTWWVPVDIIKFPYHIESNKRFSFANSSGTAGGSSFEDACLRAIFEYSERHYVAKHWLLNLPFNPIARKTLPSNLYNRIKELEANLSGKILLCLMDCKSVPHLTAIYIDKKEWPTFHFCSAADFNKEKAGQKALDELTNSLVFCPLFRKKILLKTDEVRSAREHYSFYHNPTNFENITTKLIGNHYIDWKDIPNLEINRNVAIQRKLKFLVRKVSNELGEITAVDVTAPETSEYGLSVVKIITMKGIPLWFGKTDLPLEKPVIKNNIGLLRKKNLRIHPLG